MRKHTHRFICRPLIRKWASVVNNVGSFTWVKTEQGRHFTNLQRRRTIELDWRSARGKYAKRRFPHGEKIGFVSQTGAASSHRFCFGGFRRRTPGPPPFSSMNPTAALYLERLVRFASRRPTPPPFSGMNLTPALSSAWTIASIVRRCALSSPGLLSSRLMLGSETPHASARSLCSHRSNILAARTCSLVRDKL